MCGIYCTLGKVAKVQMKSLFLSRVVGDATGSRNFLFFNILSIKRGIIAKLSLGRAQNFRTYNYCY